MTKPPHGEAIRPWSFVCEETIGRYSIFSLSRSVRSSPRSGRHHAFLRLDAPDWVNVIALTPAAEIVLVEQYRHGTDRITLEIPGGAVDPGEMPAGAAGRELVEETGYQPRELHLIGAVEPNPAFLSNTCWTYLAVGCKPSARPRPDPGEDLALRLAGLGEFTELIDQGLIRHALVIAAHDHLQRAIRRREPWLEHVVPARTADTKRT